VYSEKTPDDGQRNCLKHIEFYSKNKFEKLVHLVGFIIRMYPNMLLRLARGEDASSYRHMMYEQTFGIHVILQ